MGSLGVLLVCGFCWRFFDGCVALGGLFSLCLLVGLFVFSPFVCWVGATSGPKMVAHLNDGGCASGYGVVTRVPRYGFFGLNASQAKSSSILDFFDASQQLGYLTC